MVHVPSIAGAKQHQRCKGTPLLSVGPLEFPEHGPRIHNEALHVALVERRNGIVVGPVPLVLQVDEAAGEIPDLDAEGTHVAVHPARLLRRPVVQCPVDANPTRLTASVPVEELVGATFGQPVKQRVVDCADRPAEIRLERSAQADGDELLGRSQEVRRPQAKGPRRPPLRRGA